MRPAKFVLLLGCVVAAGASLGACREDEQGRVLIYEKGVYLGKPDTPISGDARRALSARIQQQNERAGPKGGGGSPSGAPPDVRPPPGASSGSAPVPTDILRERMRRQSGN
ncbi:MAG: hypothetical protein ACE5GT_02815 [Rhodospirillales bacterium]